METITTRGRSVEIPSHVDELSPKQYEYYIFLAYALGAGVIDAGAFRVRWLSYLIGMGRVDFTILRQQYVDELEAQLGALDGFIVERNGTPQLDFNTPVNLLPAYAGFKGPGDWLEGVTYGEFVECLTVLECMSREGRDGDREGYEHIARVLYHIPEAGKVPDVLVFHAPTLLSSVWQALLAGPVEINGRKIDFRIIFKGAGSAKADDKTGWTGITFEIATAGLFGNVAQVERTDMWAVLMYLYKCKFEYLAENRKAPVK